MTDWDRVYERFQQVVEALIPCGEAVVDGLTALCEALQGSEMEDESTVKKGAKVAQKCLKRPSWGSQRDLFAPYCSYKPNLHLPRHRPYQMRRY